MSLLTTFLALLLVNDVVGDCVSCSSGSTWWCGGQDQTCVSYRSSCSSSVQASSCIAGSSSYCSTLGTTTCGSSSSSSSSTPTTCSTCTAYGYWCGGSDQKCASSPSLCSASVYNNNCYASYSSSCSTSGATTCSSPSAMASVYSTCSACTGTSSGYIWCGGSDQKCVASSSSCSSSVSNRGCYTYYSSSCSSYGASTCTSTSSTSSTSSSYSATSSVGIDNVPAANAQVTTGVVASVILGVVSSVVILLTARMCCGPANSSPSPLMDAWKPRASSAFPALAVGIVFQSLGLLTGFAAPAIPWMSVGASASLSSYTGSASVSATVIFTTITYTYTDSFGNSVTSSMPAISVVGAVIAYIALCAFIFPSLLISWVAACRMSNVSKWGAAPPTGGCCNPGMPVVQGLSWGGTILFLIGAAIDWTLFGIIRVLISAGGVGPGGNLMVASFVFLLISCICFAVTGCCSLGPLPGVGAAATNCCCTESNPNMQPHGVTRVLSSSPQVTVIQQGGGQPGYGYPPAQAYPPQGYPMPPQGYPMQPQGYPMQPQEYPPQAYPVQAGPPPTYAAKDAPYL